MTACCGRLLRSPMSSSATADRSTSSCRWPPLVYLVAAAVVSAGGFARSFYVSNSGTVHAVNGLGSHDTRRTQKGSRRDQSPHNLRTWDSEATADIFEVAQKKYHVVVTTDGNHYTTWQTRIMFYWYLHVKEAHPDSELGGFTRLLHSGIPDKWMAEIPTVVVSGLNQDFADRRYPVLNRPFAFKQWLDNLAITEDYILMAEPDHLFLKPPPNWATPVRPAGYPFTYMTPEKFPSELRQFSRLGRNKNITDIHLHMDPLGNSPVIIHKKQLQKIAPLWAELALRMRKDSAANRAFGWIQEMYAFSLASAIVDDKPIRFDMHMEFMVQPPWDESLQVRCWPMKSSKRCPMKEVYMIHYTYGMDVDKQGKFTPGQRGHWHWDKRDYMSKTLPGNIPTPPPGTGESIVHLVAMINKAASALWPSGRM